MKTAISRSLTNVLYPTFMAAWLITITLLPCSVRAETTAYSGGVQITSFPATITSPGTYFLAQDVVVNLPNGVCFNVTASGVTIDLNGHTLTNNAGVGNTSYGIYAYDRSNVAVRNGTITGFYFGIFVATSNVAANSPSFGHLVENVNLVKNTFCAANLQGVGCRFFRCRAILTGGTTVQSTYYNYALDGISNSVEDCDVCGKTGSAISLGISVSNGADDFIVNNRLSGVTNGLLGGAGFKYRDNLTSGVTTPYSNGTDAGNNN